MEYDLSKKDHYDYSKTKGLLIGVMLDIQVDLNKKYLTVI